MNEKIIGTNSVYITDLIKMATYLWN